MILYELYPNKVLKPLKDEETFVTENLISSFNIIMPSTFGNYPTKELDFELRVYLPTINNGQTEYSEYMGYPLTVENNRAVVPITNDITGDVQIDKVMILATRDGNVIGKTNFVDKPILDAPLKGEPLTPREQFDEVIREQRETIAEQSQTITTQGETITQQGEQITELNGEVTELQGEVAEQQATITRQNTTIDQLNSRVPVLDTPDPVNPSLVQQTIRPATENAIGLTQVVINGATTEDVGINPEYYKAGEPCIDKVGSYAPFQALGGVYVTEEDEYGDPVSILVKNFKAYVPFPRVWSAAALAKVEFNNCPTITSFSTTLRPFNGMRTLRIVLLPNGLTTLNAYDFKDCTNLASINIPNSVVTINNSSTVFANCVSLEYVTIENGFNCNGLNLSASTRYSHDTILSWFNALADRTGKTAYTLTIGTTNLNKLTAEQKAIATNKNWNLA